MPFGTDYMRDYLKENFNSVYERQKSEDEISFILPFSGYHMTVIVNNERHFIGARIPGILQASGKHRAVVLDKAMDINYQLLLGKFACDPDDGELVFELYQGTDGFQEPWDQYEELLTRIIGIAMGAMRKDGKALREMSYTGRWPSEPDDEEEQRPAEQMAYDKLCMPILQGIVGLEDIPEQSLAEFLEKVIELALKSGRNQLEDFPESWQAALKEKLGTGSGSEI